MQTTLTKTKHTQKGYDLWVVRLSIRVSKMKFYGYLAEAKAMGGWWSGYDKDGAIPGFQFKTEGQAVAFSHALGSSPEVIAAPAGTTAIPPAPMEVAKQKAMRLRDLAAGMDATIEGKINSGISQQNPTARRIRIADSMRHEGENLQQTQAVLRRVADELEAGTVPAELGLNFTKNGVHEALHYGSQKDTALAKWLKGIVTAPVKDEKAEKIRKIENELLFSDIPGYFPTPPELVARMVAFVQPEAGEVILEPSAGSGAIACAINHGATVEALEVNYSLRELLTLKGVNLVGADFMEFEPGKEYDAVVMNPPFERGQDIEHVHKAYGHLKEGGRLAAITSPGFTFRDDARFETFRQWLDAVNAEIEDVPAGSFKRSGTGVAAKMIFIQK